MPPPDLESKNAARDGGQPRHKMKETLRGDRNAKEKDGHGHGPSPLGDNKGDSHKDNTRGGGVKGKLKNLFGGKHEEEVDEEPPAEDDAPPKHKGSAAPKDGRRDVPSKHAVLFSLLRRDSSLTILFSFP